MLGNQRGAVLATSLIVLVVMTLLVLGMLRTSVLELKIGGIAQTSAQNFSNAEVALTKFMNDNNGRFKKDCLVAPASSESCFCTNPNGTPALCQVENVAGNETSLVTEGVVQPTIRIGRPSLALADQPLYGAQQTDITATTLSSCIEESGAGSGNQMDDGSGKTVTFKYQYLNIKAVSNGTVSGQVTVNQGIKAFCG